MKGSVMKVRNLILALVVLTVLGASAAGKRSSKSNSSKSKLPLVSPISLDSTEARISATEVDVFFESEMNLRERMLANRFFAKPMSDQKSSFSQIVGYLAVDPLHGLQPRFVIGTDADFKAQADFKALQRYSVDGHVRSRLMTLLRKGQIVLFDRPAKMISQAEFYNSDIAREASAGLIVADKIIYTIAAGMPEYFKETAQDKKNGTWSDVLEYCKVDDSQFHYYFAINFGNGHLKLSSYFENQLAAAKTHGDALPPPMVEEWAASAKKFLEEDVAQFKGVVAQAKELAGGNSRVLAIYENDIKVIAAMEQILKGMLTLRTQFEDEGKPSGKLRTGKGLYKYTKGKYSLLSFPKDKVPDHLFIFDFILQRFQNEMKGKKAHYRGVTEEQRRKAAEWKKEQDRKKAGF